MAVLTNDIPVVRIEGIDLKRYVISEVLLCKELLKPASLTFTMRKKVLADSESDIQLDTASSMIGKRVSLELSTLCKDKDMNTQSENLAFEGIVFGVKANREKIGQTIYYNVTAYSPDYLLVDNPHCMSFEDMTLQDIINQCVQPYNGVLDLEIAPRETDIQHYVVQYNETTYQFISRLAQRHGEFFFYDRGRMYFGCKPIGCNITLYPDVDILGFSYDLNMEHTEFHHAQHDYLIYDNISDEGYRNSIQSVHHLTDAVFDASHSLYRKQTLQNIHSALQEDSTFMQVQSSSTIEGLGAKSRMTTCRMRTNRADICIGDRLSIQETASCDSTKINHEEMLVVGVRYHATINGHFENEVTTIPAKSEYPPYYNVDLYPLCESQRAQVVDNRDPEQLGRIRVRFLWQELQDNHLITPWIRITQPHGGDDKGFYFIPEIGEEVMVAFENGNAERPYAVGTLYHGKQRPGYPWYSDSNDIKAIRTRDGHTIEIHDVDPGGYIRIYDYQKENYILTFSTDQKLIKLESTGNIELYAKNDIIMQAGHDIIGSAHNDITYSAGNDYFMSAGNDMQRSADNDIREYANNDRNTNIGHNDSINIDENQFVTIGDSKDDRITKKLQITAENIRIEAEKQLLQYSETHHQKAEKEMAINAGQKIDIKASTVKTN